MWVQDFPSKLVTEVLSHSQYYPGWLTVTKKAVALQVVRSPPMSPALGQGMGPEEKLLFKTQLLLLLSVRCFLSSPDIP